MKLLELGLKRKQLFLIGLVATVLLTIVVIRMVAGPLFLALVIAYILHPLLVHLEKFGLSRSTQAWLIVGLGCIALFVGSWFLGPLLLKQLKSLTLQIPQFRQYIETSWLPSLSTFLHDNVGSVWREARTLSIRDILPPSLIPGTDFWMASLERSTRAVANVILAALLTPFFTFFFIAREKQLVSRIQALIPHDLRSFFSPLALEFDHTLRTVLRGQIIVITLLSLLYSTAFAVAGMPMALAVGVITGVMRLVPYMDLAVGGTLAFFVLVTSSDVTVPVVLGVLGSFALIQVLDMLLITPRIVGRFSGIHPFVLILAVLCFGDWFGFFGVLLAIPMTAVARVFLKRLLLSYQRSGFFLNDQNWGDRQPPFPSDKETQP